MIKKIILLCPSDNLSGGPECIYQLADSFSHFLDNVFIFYFGNKDIKISMKRFDYYKFKVIEQIEDDEENLIIFPESATRLIYNFPKSEKCIYWMSVDNYYRYKDTGLITKLFKRFLSLFKSRAKLSDLKNLLHITQSEYASIHLENIGFKHTYLGDYLPDIFFKDLISSEIRNNYVLYNPKKGIKYIKKLREISPEIEFKAIENMTQTEVKNLLAKSKVYIDFGHHPGKDRIPREALMSGCCVVTNLKGSAGNEVDVPILPKYKIDIKDRNSLINTKEIIYECLNNYQERFLDFKNYENEIKNQKNQFFLNVKNFIIEQNLL